MKPNARIAAQMAMLGLGAGMVIPSGMLTREAEHRELVHKCKFAGLHVRGNESSEELRAAYERATAATTKPTTIIRELFVKFEPKSQDERRKERNKRKARRRASR